MDIDTIATVATTLAGFVATYLALTRNVDKRFDMLERRMDRFENRMDMFDDRLYALATGLKPVIEQAQEARPAQA